ncbi:hypothetical protein K469DRAFT_674859 [Zopfia rhizophila CBS 207.26]|uniref:Protein kinase domain-containing protein n=1 Tax=Zopfia rhizophila CBS 207.26 TaxID=1314779 RepID=A0A6A6DI37_9PEZI|nr:hypothetical protein K469DRAFT_674859 [Zopfia rhizophila CBS 207.26]
MFVEQARADSVLCPNIHSTRDVKNVCEVTDSNTGAFLRTTFSYVDKEDIVWFGRTPGIRKYDITVEDIERSLRRVPDEKIYPLETSLISTVPDADQKDLFIKRPKLSCVDDEEEVKLVPRMLLEEAEVLEFLKQHPHPNLIRYHGCTANRGYITGIALDKHDVILLYRHEDVSRDLNIAACMDGIRAGVRHLHSLGLAHNDLNPMNIAVDHDDNPIILDFGSCKRFGERLLFAGTDGWVDEDYSTSAQCHDEAAIDKIEAWLIEAKDKKVVNGP